MTPCRGMSNTRRKCQILAEKIGYLFKKGLFIDQDVIHYMDSTFSTHDIHTLEAVIQDQSDCEREPLIELLYFPDESIQVQLEAFFESAVFERGDEKTVLAHLSLSLGETLFYFSDNRSGWKLQTPIFGASAFLSRLNISNNLDKRLITAIHLVTRNADRNRYKVKIRNAGFDMDQKKIDCLEAFFLKSDPGCEGFLERFHFVLHFLGEWKGAGGLLDALAEKKRLYIKQLQQASKFEALCEDRNIETLMILGIRLPHMDRQDIVRKIGMIDDISLAIFGRTVYVNSLSLH
jgi:hypothetical protein